MSGRYTAPTRKRERAAMRATAVALGCTCGDGLELRHRADKHWNARHDDGCPVLDAAPTTLVLIANRRGYA